MIRQSAILLVMVLVWNVTASVGQSMAAQPAAPAGQTEKLTLAEAEKIAIQNHPQIQAAQDVAEAASQRVRQERSS